MLSGRRFVSYLRVSTDKQGRSGLGLEAQRAAVATHVVGAHGVVVAEFIEIESGRKKDRPQLDAALTACRAHRAVLVIAKLDRLARNVHFVSGLMESGVEFVASDMPTVNRLTVHILAAVAEEEARMISARTKAALAAAKERYRAEAERTGQPEKKLGTPRNLQGDDAQRGRALGRAARTAMVTKRTVDLAPIIQAITAEGQTSLNQIAVALNERRLPASRGGAWSAAQVARVRARIRLLDEPRTR